MNNKISEYLNQLFDKTLSLDFLNELNTNLSNNIYLSNFSLKSFFVNYLLEKTKSKVLILTKDFYTQQEFISDINFFNADVKPYGLLESVSFQPELYGTSEPLGHFIQKIEQFSKEENSVLIGSIDMLSIDFPTKENISASLLTVSVGDKLIYDEFIMDLVLKGFFKTDYVATEGEIAVRGSIIDIFPLGSTNPYRIEFWGNEIESIREFDSISQRSINNVSQISFLSDLFDSSQIETKTKINKLIPSNTIIIIDEQVNINQEVNLLDYFGKFKKVYINPLEKSNYQILVNQQQNYKNSLNEFIQQLKDFHQNTTLLYIVSDNKNYLDRLKILVQRYFEENDFNEINFLNYYRKIKWIESPLSTGFITKDLKFAILTEHQIFDRINKVNQKSSSSKTSLTLKELENLQVGDYVVHEDKGIGQFDGFQTIKVGDVMQDCVRVKYQDGDILYVYMNLIHKIDKYSSSEDTPPKLSKLGSSEWERRKSKLKKKLKDISRELMKLYAMRKTSDGFAYPTDTLWQKEFEASFMFEDTIDQAKATDDVKEDMEQTAPMDRLVCGDVGFGKTEIAIRAAFKAAINGKQVAVLVPTTILAKQHYMSFKDRMERYPVKLALLSRFRTATEIKKDLERIEMGKVDIVIGTHRILSKDVNFKDLGLLIIDEEHRFGVSAKEKLRQIKANVDTLTMTATPIPRTLNFSLLGVRDISIIETPPPNRLPVYTEIMRWDKEHFKKAATKELNRNGQIFFVSDKVYDLNKIAAEIQTILPSAKIGIAHGQMKTSDLEKVMERFVAKQFDILVTTKIVESGLDIPSANTIFINRAQNFGLAELYQLRGRVGRSNIQAYSYLIVPNDTKISEKSIKRLQAIEEFSELGSGMKLAMRDMEIRGAGNLLGAEQSGYIDDIGYELYSKILDEAVQELKEEEFSELFKDKLSVSNKLLRNKDLEIDFDKNSFLNHNYIESETERFVLYRKMYGFNKLEEIKNFENELVDRFGKIPEETQNLIFILRLRVLGLNTGFKRISINKNTLKIELPLESNEYFLQVFPILLDYFETINYKYEIKQTQTKIFVQINEIEQTEIIELLWKLKKHLELQIEN